MILRSFMRELIGIACDPVTLVRQDGITNHRFAQLACHNDATDCAGIPVSRGFKFRPPENTWGVEEE